MTDPIKFGQAAAVLVADAAYRDDRAMRLAGQVAENWREAPSVTSLPAQAFQPR